MYNRVGLVFSKTIITHELVTCSRVRSEVSLTTYVFNRPKLGLIHAGTAFEDEIYEKVLL